jgi:POTRA domain, FtsQ-type/Cell division protein FtsQ
MRPALRRIGFVLGAAALLVALAALAPFALRHCGMFAIRRVEVIGVRHLSAERAVAASGIVQSASVFDDAAPWREALLAHALVAAVRIERRLPHTIVLHITETVPVAFARTPQLRAIDARGRILPADHAADDMDLPVLTFNSRVSAAGHAVDRTTLRVVAFLEEVRRAEPALLGWVSEAGAHGDGVRLVLRSATDADVLLPSQPSPERLRELHLTLADLATPRVVTDARRGRSRAADSELSRVQRIDVRFHDQIVVALHGGKS